jgi:hypothetical protein
MQKAKLDRDQMIEERLDEVFMRPIIRGVMKVVYLGCLHVCGNALNDVLESITDESNTNPTASSPQIK